MVQYCNASSVKYSFGELRYPQSKVEHIKKYTATSYEKSIVLNNACHNSNLHADFAQALNAHVAKHKNALSRIIYPDELLCATFNGRYQHATLTQSRLLLYSSEYHRSVTVFCHMKSTMRETSSVGNCCERSLCSSAPMISSPYPLYKRKHNEKLH